MARCGLGNDTRPVVREFERIKTNDVLLPNSASREIGIRCLSRLDESQRILLAASVWPFLLAWATRRGRTQNVIVAETIDQKRPWRYQKDRWRPPLVQFGLVACVSLYLLG